MKSFLIIVLMLFVSITTLYTKNNMLFKYNNVGVYSSSNIEQLKNQSRLKLSHFLNDNGNNELNITLDKVNTQFIDDNTINVIRYVGYIDSDPGSEVFFTIINNDTYCRVIKSDGSCYNILSKDNTILTKEETTDDLHFECYSEESESIYKEIKSKFNHILSNKLLVCNIAVETTKEFYTAFNKDTNAIKNYVINLFSMVSFIYEKEINITFNISFLKIWTKTDPYNCAGNPNTLLLNGRTYWKTNNLKVEPNLVHFLTIGGQGGVGNYDAINGGSFNNWIGVHCGWGYAASSILGTYTLPAYSFTYDVFTVAHELGHNFNCPHTHSCYWDPPIDTCALDEGIQGGCLNENQQKIIASGSIMSYCREINGWTSKMEFLEKPAKFIRDYAEKSPLKEYSDKYIRLIIPESLNNYITHNNGDTIDITWYSNSIDKVNIYYIIKDSTKEHLIATVADSNKKYKYIIDNFSSCKQITIKIADSKKPLISDETHNYFDIKGTPISVTGNYPKDKMEIDSNPIFTWYKMPKDICYDENEITYELQVANDIYNGTIEESSLVAYIKDIPNKEYSIKYQLQDIKLQYNKIYYWRIRTVAETNLFSNWSDIKSFKIKEPLPNGISEIKDSKEFYIQNNLIIVQNNNEINNIILFDILGNKVINTYNNIIDLTNYSDGLYLLKINNNMYSILK